MHPMYKFEMYLFTHRTHHSCNIFWSIKTIKTSFFLLVCYVRFFCMSNIIVQVLLFELTPKPFSMPNKPMKNTGWTKKRSTQQNATTTQLSWGGPGSSSMMLKCITKTWNKAKTQTFTDNHTHSCREDVQTAGAAAAAAPISCLKNIKL